MTTKTKLDLEAEVAAYVEINDKIEQLNIDKANIVARLRTLAPGIHQTSFGIGVTVTAPPRSFNTARAWDMLTTEQQALCVSPDAKKIRSQLPPVLAEQCMDEGTGEPRVSVR